MLVTMVTEDPNESKQEADGKPGGSADDGSLVENDEEHDEDPDGKNQTSETNCKDRGTESPPANTETSGAFEDVIEDEGGTSQEATQETLINDKPENDST